MAYHKTTTVKVVRTRHRIENYYGAAPESMRMDLMKVPPNAKLVLVEGPDDNGCFAIEFEEEQSEHAA